MINNPFKTAKQSDHILSWYEVLSPSNPHIGNREYFPCFVFEMKLLAIINILMLLKSEGLQINFDLQPLFPTRMLEYILHQ
jgi:hypothetical protein